jgi:hypothetical protein
MPRKPCSRPPHHNEHATTHNSSLSPCRYRLEGTWKLIRQVHTKGTLLLNSFLVRDAHVEPTVGSACGRALPVDLRGAAGVPSAQPLCLEAAHEARHVRRRRSSSSGRPGGRMLPAARHFAGSSSSWSSWRNWTRTPKLVALPVLHNSSPRLNCNCGRLGDAIQAPNAGTPSDRPFWSPVRLCPLRCVRQSCLSMKCAVRNLCAGRARWHG